MAETDGILRNAAKNYNQAESRLEGAENELRKLMERLESCMVLMRSAAGVEPETEQTDKSQCNQPTVAIDQMEMVGS